MLSLLLFQRIAELFLMIFMGWIVVKVGVLQTEDSRCLSMILLYIIAPSVFFNAFQIERTPEVLSMMAFSAVLALIFNVLLILLGDLSAKLLHLDVVEEASIIYPNSGNMAIPLVSAIFGTEWVVFVTLYNMIQNLFVWTHCRMFVSGERKVSLRKILLNINILAILAGALMFFLNIQLPGIVHNALTSVGNMIGPAAMIIVGIMFFTLGAEMSMSPMGERVGAMLTKSRSVPLIIGVGFLLGFLITISEPDLQVLANQVPSIPNMTLILSVAAGVGLFLVVAFLRMLLGIALPKLLVVFYGLIFVLAAFVPKEFLSVAFDSGGVTTGPITVPFIMALGVGVAAIRSDRHAADDSFGLVALCSIGPILAVLILGIAFQASDSTYVPPILPNVSDSVELWQLFHEGLPTYIKEIATSLLPIIAMFGVFQLAALKLDRRTLGRIGVGLAYTYLGLVLFLAGANIGFMPAGNYLGQVLAGQSFRWLLVPIGMLIGYFIVKAEPAVYVLNKQVEEVTDGAISASTMGAALSAGVSLSVGLAMVRVLTGISILWFLIPGYAFAIGISFVVPKLYTAIAFDAGGVASGPMTATFLLPLAQGACVAVGGNIVTDAFGVVAMVAMTPLITVQLMGLMAQLKQRRARQAQPVSAAALAFADLPDDAIIEL